MPTSRIERFGKTSDGIEVDRITLYPQLPRALEVSEEVGVWQDVHLVVITYGAAINQLWLPGWTDSDGQRTCEGKKLTLADVVLGYTDVSDYETNGPSHGVIIGRVAGRISNAKFTVPQANQEPSLHKVTKNFHEEHCLHGGRIGLSHRVWKIAQINRNSVKLATISPNGEDGFPGTLEVFVTYTLDLTEQGEVHLRIDYSASINEDACPVNLTSHAYYNLAGHRAGPKSLEDHTVYIKAAKICELEAETALPTGRLLPAGQIPDIDLRSAPRLSAGLHRLGKAPFTGYDDYYVFEEPGVSSDVKVIVTEPTSGRQLKIFTDQPGVVFYTGNYLNADADPVGKNGHHYTQHSGFALETQGYPDAVNRAEFPSIILSPEGEKYKQSTRFTFSLLHDQ